MRAELAYARTDAYRHKQHQAAVKRAVSAVVYTLIILLLVGTLVQLIYTKRTGEAPTLFGYYLFRIETPSMDPTLPVGSVILSKKPSDTSALSEGTVVTFLTSGGERITHRIVGVAAQQDGSVAYLTKGDNPINSIDLELLTPERIVAIFVVKIPLF